MADTTRRMRSASVVIGLTALAAAALTSCTDDDTACVDEDTGQEVSDYYCDDGYNGYGYTSYRGGSRGSSSYDGSSSSYGDSTSYGGYGHSGGGVSG